MSSLAPSWRTPTFIVDTSLADCTKNETANTIYKNLFNEILDASTSSTQMYTDAYKTSTGVGIAIIYDLSTSYRFLEQNSIYTAEYKALLEGVKIATQSTDSNFNICTDSLSALNNIKV